MCDKLIEDLTKIEKNKACENLKQHIEVNEVERIKDTYLKLVAKLLVHANNECKKFFTDKKIQQNRSLQQYLRGKIKR